MTSSNQISNDLTPLDENVEEILRRYHVHMPEIGQTIGSNRIIDLIAEGGMANVYKAWHEELEIIRAIKILKPGFDDESKMRLRTEAKISAHLHHPNIVEIYGVHFWNETIPYLEMEYVDGESLKSLLDKENRLHYTVAASLIQYICTALHYAHNQVFTLYGKSYEGIVHRDIKPANILMTRSGEPKLADFGIAKPIDISLHTVGQKVMGTFAYLSPEQLNGGTLDRRSDIYSLGIVLYECITGEKAFPQNTLADLINVKFMNKYNKISSIGVDVPKKLLHVLEKSMRTDREKRYNDAEEFGMDLLDALGKGTNEQPQRILTNFFAGHSVPATRLTKSNKPRIPMTVVLATCFIGLAIIFAMLLADAIKTKRIHFTKQHQDSKNTTVLYPNTTSQNTVAIDNKNTPLSKAPPEEIKKAQISTPEPIAKKETVLSPLSLGVGAFKAEKYDNAIPFLEKAIVQEKADSSRHLATVCLLESYLVTNNLTNALKLISEETVNDGYYYLLCGKAYLKINKPELSITELKKAQVTPSRFRKNIAKESSFLLSSAYTNAYSAKPNSDNKRFAIKAWRQFQTTYCTEPDHLGQCKTAAEALIGLAQ